MADHPPTVAQTGGQFDPTGKYRLKHSNGAFATVEVCIVAEEGPSALKAECGTMISMSHAVEYKLQKEGSLGSALFRSAFTGASAWFMHFGIRPGTPPGVYGDVVLSPSLPGDIILLHVVSGRDWCLAKHTFLACDASVSITTQTQSLGKALLGGQGLFIIKASGQGRLLVSLYGGILRYDLQPGEVRRIDHGYLVAWESHMPYKIGRSGRTLVGTLTSGEGFLSEFTGPGTLYMQTKSIESLAHVVSEYIPK